MLHETLDGAALAGGVAALEQRDDLLPGLFHPALAFQQFALHLDHFLLVHPTAQHFIVGVFAVFEQTADHRRISAQSARLMRIGVDDRCEEFFSRGAGSARFQRSCCFSQSTHGIESVSRHRGLCT